MPSVVGPIARNYGFVTIVAVAQFAGCVPAYGKQVFRIFRSVVYTIAVGQHDGIDLRCSGFEPESECIVHVGGANGGRTIYFEIAALSVETGGKAFGQSPFGVVQHEVYTARFVGSGCAAGFVHGIIAYQSDVVAR